jgi:hypothetical protein
MVKKEEKYIPEKGDIVLISFFSVEGHEQNDIGATFVKKSIVIASEAKNLIIPAVHERLPRPYGARNDGGVLSSHSLLSPPSLSFLHSLSFPRKRESS